MKYIVLAAWLIQAGVGVSLLIGWARHARGAGAALVLPHILLMVGFLVPWSMFAATGDVLWAWASIGVLLIGIPFGDAMMVRRSRRIRGESNPGLRDYGPAIATAFAGRLPPTVTFHAIFSAVVFFAPLGVAIAATVTGE